MRVSARSGTSRRSAEVRRRPGFAALVGKFVLYGLAAVGGMHLGTQAYSAAEQRFPELVRSIGDRFGEGRRPTHPAQAARRPEPSRPSARPSPAANAPASGGEEPRVSVTPVQPGAPDGGEPVPTADPPVPMAPIEINRGGGARPEVSLTFDAGSDWRPVKAILEALLAGGHKATFFVTGEWVQENPKMTKRIVTDGHELANHSWDHEDFTKLTDDQIREQLRRTEELVAATAGKSTRPYFRPPLGARDRRVREIVGQEGFLTIYWSLDSRDSVDKDITSEQIQARVVGLSTPGSIVLLHCGSAPTAEALPGILKGLTDKGLTPVTLSRLLEE